MLDTATPKTWREVLTAAPNPFEIAIGRYARAPIAFVREILGVEPDPWQLKALRALAQGHTRIAIRSGHGVGKSCFAAWTVVWFACTRAPFKVAVTAPTAPQLQDVLVPEMHKWFEALPTAWRSLWDITSDHIRLKRDPECFVTARTSRPETPEAMAGVHSQHVLLVADEASGIPEPVYEAAGGSMSSTGAITLLIGNPVRSTGFFWRVCTLERERWFTMQVSSADSPRVAQSYVDEMAQRYGTNSNAYRIRVTGEFPSSDADTFIPADIVDDAMARDVVLDISAPEVWGVDCARFGDDDSVLIKRKGAVVTEMPRSWRQLDTMQLAGAVKAEWDHCLGRKPNLICIDAIGIGAGVADRLAEQGLPVLAVNVAEVPSLANRYMRLRDELWGRGREWLNGRACRLPKHERLRDDLCAPRYSFSPNGNKLQIESKALMKSRGLPSCDYADALLLTFADQTLGVATQEFGGLFTQEPVRRCVMGME